MSAVGNHGAGTDQDLHDPMGVGGMAPHNRVFGTKTFQKMSADYAEPLIGDEVGREGIDDEFVAHGFENIAAGLFRTRRLK